MQKNFVDRRVQTRPHATNFFALYPRYAILETIKRSPRFVSRAGVGNVHAIAHTLGGLYNTPHGLANAVILPIVLEDYGEAVQEKLAHLAELTGVKFSGTDAEKAKAFVGEIRAMNQRMNIPAGFDFIQEKDIPQMVEWALAEANPVYPVPAVHDRKRCEKVIRCIMAEG